MSSKVKYSFDMDIDNQSEDGEIKKSPLKDMDDFRYKITRCFVN